MVVTCGLVKCFHGLKQLRQRDPVWRVLEACRVQDQNQISHWMVPRHRSKVPIPRLIQQCTRVRQNQECIFLFCHFFYQSSEVLLFAGFIHSDCFSVQGIAVCQADKLIKRNSFFKHDFSGHAAVQHVFMIPLPWAWKNNQCQSQSDNNYKSLLWTDDCFNTKWKVEQNNAKPISYANLNAYIYSTNQKGMHIHKTQTYRHIETYPTNYEINTHKPIQEYKLKFQCSVHLDSIYLLT